MASRTLSRPASASSLLSGHASVFSKADPTAGNHIIQQLFPDENRWQTITSIENARPWSRPDVTWTDMKASRASLSTTRTSTANYELTMPSHFPTYSRRGRGPTTYANSFLLPELSRDSSLSSSPSLRSLRLQERGVPYSPMSSYAGGRTPLERPRTAAMLPRTTSTPKMEPWQDPCVAGIGYNSKFYYRA